MSRRLIVLVCVAGALLLASTASAELVGHWPFDEGSGNLAGDVTGIIGDGTFTGDVSWGAGISKGALELDGDGDYVTFPNNDQSQLRSTGSFTVAAWVRVDKTDNGVILMVGEGCSTWASWYLGVGGGEPDAPRDEGNLVFATRAAGGSAYDGVATPLEPDVWVHVAATYDGTTLTLYQDAIEVASADASLPYVNADPFYLGGDPGCSGRQWFGGAIDDLQIYDEALPENEIKKIMKANAAQSGSPLPEDEATDIPRDTVLAWIPGEFAVTHDVYLGTVFEDVNDASRDNPMDLLVSEGQTEATYVPPAVLEFGQTYYWRVDEVNGAPDNTIFKGEVWSFTVEPFAYPITDVIATSNGVSEAGVGPERTVDGSGLNENDEHSTTASEMWLAVPGADPLQIQYEFDRVYKLHELLVWNYNVQFEMMLGFGLKDVTVEYSENGTDWMALGDVEFAQATSKPGYAANTTVAFDGVGAKYVRLTVNSGHGMIGQFGLSEVRFLFIPVQAREPEPADGATDVTVSPALSWRAGRDSVSHDVYFGVDAETLELAGTPDTAAYSPGDLDLGTVYSWRVDETGDAVWEGDLWSFTTQAYLVVDDFESYDDEDNRIYDTWLDGFVNETGSTVGHFQTPFAEQTIVHEGNQSMPLFFDNGDFATSEADFELSQDWSLHGIKGLSLYFYGDVGNSGAQLYVKINGNQVDYDGAAVSMLRPSWQLWSIDLSTVGNVSNVSSLTIGIGGAGAQGVVYIDDIRLYPEVMIAESSPDITGAGDTVQGVPNDDDWPAAEYPALATDDDVETKYLHRKGGSMATGFQIAPLLGSTVVTGVTFTTANDVPTRDPVSFELSGSNASIDGPYELIAAGEIVDFAGATEWPRFTKTETPIEFENTTAYTYYQIVFPTLRGAGETLMQIAEVELVGAVAQ